MKKSIGVLFYYMSTMLESWWERRRAPGFPREVVVRADMPPGIQETTKEYLLVFLGDVANRHAGTLGFDDESVQMTAVARDKSSLFYTTLLTIFMWGYFLYCGVVFDVKVGRVIGYEHEFKILPGSGNPT